MVQHDYLPGQCNIGPAEIKARMRMGYIGLGLMLLFIILAEVFHFPKSCKLLLFVPSTFALSGFLQAKQKFCFLYGFLGLFSFTGKQNKIYQHDALRKDRKKAVLLVLQMLSGSAILGGLYYVLF